MKRIVIACDGTWKRIDAPDPTNVARLAQAVLPVAPGRVPQIVCHLDGVGTGQGTGRVSRALDRALGGAFGQGLMASVAAAYRFLVFTWAPGDEIQLFGFSRGAYTARSLAGLIRNVGILPRRVMVADRDHFMASAILRGATALYLKRTISSAELRAAQAAGRPVLAVFQGPQAYISPGWYASKAEHGRVVPTWNYLIVQVRGVPRVIEDALYEHPDVLEAVVVGVPDDYRGEAPKAFVVKQGRLEEADVIAWVAARVTAYKKVRAVAFVDAIPRNAAGKILRKDL